MKKEITLCLANFLFASPIEQCKKSDHVILQELKESVNETNPRATIEKITSLQNKVYPTKKEQATLKRLEKSKTLDLNKGNRKKIMQQLIKRLDNYILDLEKELELTEEPVKEEIRLMIERTEQVKKELLKNLAKY